jgi:hypothetical protein
MDSITAKKINSLEADGYDVSGAILVGVDGKRMLVEMGAVRSLTNDEMWKLMHPADVRFSVEFEGRTFLLRRCPWCAAGQFSIRALGRVWTGMKYGEASSYEVLHHCEPIEGQPSRAVVRVGRDLESAVSAWNERK